MFGNNREEIRRFFLACWDRREEPMLSLSPLEQQVIHVLKLHPEYHALFENSAEALVHRDFPDGTASGNPFYHLGLHISLHEQISTDRPPGIRQLYQQYKTGFGDLHEAEHAMLEVLERALWEAQASNRMPDDAAYLAALQKRLREKQAG
jgi:hypothetical protein